MALPYLYREMQIDSITNINSLVTRGTVPSKSLYPQLLHLWNGEDNSDFFERELE